MGTLEPADALVMFGITGDLAKKKLFPALYALERDERPHVPIIGVARPDCDRAGLHAYAAASIADYGDKVLSAMRRGFGGHHEKKDEA
ncbi:MAG: hypothetical protein GY724_13970 [Actinomycetia bacterium]|nr:hypothetical protein [Actinomycetes bacterium]